MPRVQTVVDLLHSAPEAGKPSLLRRGLPFACVAAKGYRNLPEIKQLYNKTRA